MRAIMQGFIGSRLGHFPARQLAFTDDHVRQGCKYVELIKILRDFFAYIKLNAYDFRLETRAKSTS